MNVTMMMRYEICNMRKEKKKKSIEVWIYIYIIIIIPHNKFFLIWYKINK